MTRLRGVAERALASNDAESQREALSTCLEESERILAMLDTLMDISEAETGTMRLSVTDVPLATLVEEVVSVYEDVADEKQIAVRSTVDAGPDGRQPIAIGCGRCWPTWWTTPSSTRRRGDG